MTTKEDVRKAVWEALAASDWDDVPEPFPSVDDLCRDLAAYSEEAWNAAWDFLEPTKDEIVCDSYGAAVLVVQRVTSAMAPHVHTWLAANGR